MTRNAGRRQRGGVALVTVLAFMAVALPITASAMSLSSTLSIDSRLKTNSLGCHYAAVAGEQYAKHLIVTDPAYRPDDPSTPVEVSTTVNGCDVTAEVNMSSAMVAGSQLTIVIDEEYTVLAGHQIEVKLTVDEQTDQHMLVAYDAVDYDTYIKVPYGPDPADHVKYHLHNFPTPPTGDTNIQHPLPMDPTPPAATTLYNYSKNRDADPGRFIQRGGHPTDETQSFKYQNWQTAPLATDFTITDDVTAKVWVAMNMFSPEWDGAFNLCLRDFDGSSYAEIGCTTMVVETASWEGGGFTGFAAESSYDVVTSSGGSILYSRVLIE